MLYCNLLQPTPSMNKDIDIKRIANVLLQSISRHKELEYVCLVLSFLIIYSFWRSFENSTLTRYCQLFSQHVRFFAAIVLHSWKVLLASYLCIIALFSLSLVSRSIYCANNMIPWKPQSTLNQLKKIKMSILNEINRKYISLLSVSNIRANC